MPKVKRLIKNVYDNTKKQSSESRLFNVLRQGYGFNYRYLCNEFGVKYGDLEDYFLNAYERMTLKDFDFICSLCVNHKPEELLELIKMPKNEYGLNNILNSIDNIKKIKDWYGDKRSNDLEKMLNSIIYSETFEDRQDAIELAKRKMNKVSFKF